MEQGNKQKEAYIEEQFREEYKTQMEKRAARQRGKECSDSEEVHTKEETHTENPVDEGEKLEAIVKIAGKMTQDDHRFLFPANIYMIAITEVQKIIAVPVLCNGPYIYATNHSFVRYSYISARQPLEP